MILISVDLPAPLSPSRPSTSPFPRCRSMFFSAVTGPKRFDTPSTRRTSSRICSDTAPPPHASEVDVDHHRHQDRHAEDEVQVVGVDALQDQAVAQHAEEQRAEQRADRRALAAGQQRSPRRNGAPTGAPTPGPPPRARGAPPTPAADPARNIVPDAPAVSGVTELDRLASSTPTKPAKTLHMMKLRMTIARTLTPA